MKNDDDSATTAARSPRRRTAGRSPVIGKATYGALVEQAGDAIFIHDRSGRILDVNPKAAEFLGYTREELLTKSVVDIDTEIDLHVAPSDAEERLERVWAGEQATFETRLQHRDGSLIPVEVALGALRLPGGQFLLAIVRDITKRKSQELAYKQLVDAMNDAAFVTDYDGRFLEANKRAVEIYGYSRTELLTMGPTDIDAYRGPELIKKDLTEMRSTERRVLETLHRTKDGQVLPVEISLSRVLYGGRQAVLSIARDLTGLRDAEGALRALTRRNTAMLQTIPDIIAEVDANKTYTWLNDAGLEFFGDGVIGRQAAHYFDGEQETYLSVQPLFEGNADISYVESWQRRQDGQKRLLAWRCRALKDDLGKVTGALSSARDITERRQAEVMTKARLRLLELATTCTVEDFLRATLDELETLTESQIGFCNFFDASEDLITAAAWSTRTLSEYCKANREGLHLRVSEAGVWADCIRERHPIVHNDYATLPHRRGTPPGHGALIREIVVPVFRGDKIVAVFAVGNKPGPYTEQDVDAVTSLADLAWDTAARMQAESALQESDTRNRRMLDASPDAVLLSDTNGHYLDCNQTAIDRYGYSREELLRMTYEDLAATGLRGRTQENVPETLTRGVTTFEWRHRRKDGSELPVEIRAATFVGAQGQTRVLATVRDLTETKRAEEALRRSEDEFRALFEAAPVGIGVADMQGRLLAFNEAILAPGNYSREDVVKIGNVAALYYDAGERETALALFQAQGLLNQHETRFRRKDGTPYDVWLSLTHTTFDGAPCIQAMVEDRTEKRRAEEALRRSEEQLRQSLKMESVGRLAGGVAHDFNNMLGVILGHTELAMEELGPDHPAYGNLLEIRNAANRSAGITQQLLTFARRQVVAPALLDVSASVEGMLDILRRLIGEDAELDWLPGNDLGLVEIDSSQLDQVLVNLCANSRDAISGGGRVTIRTSAALLDQSFCETHEGCAPGEYVLLAVSDNGTGMADEALAHLFEPFFTTKEPGRGTGLGLPTVYGIVSQNKGFIDVVTEKGAGTTVAVYLPRRTGEAAMEQRKVVAETSPGGNETLLLVEDEVSVLKLTGRILSNLGYKVLTAQSPNEALSVAKAHQGEIDLLVTDVIMPEMNGWELSQRLLALRPGLRTLLVSGYTDEVFSTRGVLDEGVHFLEKPFTAQRLAASVRAALTQE